jgi:hypothetical protein
MKEVEQQWLGDSNLVLSVGNLQVISFRFKVSGWIHAFYDNIFYSEEQ